MKTATLDDLMTLNEHLAALVRAEVPLDFGFKKSGAATSTELQKINTAIARRVSRGATLTEALEADEPDVPEAYRSMVQLGMRSDDMQAALDGANCLALSVAQSRHTVYSSLVYPIAICTLAYVGIVCCCLFFVPTLEGLHKGFRIQPQSGLRILQTMRGTMPYWIGVVPLCLFLLLGASLFRKSKRGQYAVGASRPLPGASSAVFFQRCAVFSDSLSSLLNSGVPLNEGLLISGQVCGDPALGETAQSLSTMLTEGDVPNDDTPSLKRFPPFLRWSLLHAEPITELKPALDLAAGVYREIAQRRADRFRVVAPMATCVVLGGGVTLLYGLVLFIPVVQMLCALAQ